MQRTWPTHPQPSNSYNQLIPSRSTPIPTHPLIYRGMSWYRGWVDCTPLSWLLKTCELCPSHNHVPVLIGCILFELLSIVYIQKGGGCFMMAVTGSRLNALYIHHMMQHVVPLTWYSGVLYDLQRHQVNAVAHCVATCSDIKRCYFRSP